MHSPSNFIDALFSSLDNGLRSTFAKPNAKRPSPANKHSDDPIASNANLQKFSASLMRVNHVGEVCAQALYQGQALTSHSEEVKNKMKHAADEEIDHLNWCYQRISEFRPCRRQMEFGLFSRDGKTGRRTFTLSFGPST